MRPLEDGFHVEFFCKVGLFVFLVVLVATVPWGGGCVSHPLVAVKAAM